MLLQLPSRADANRLRSMAKDFLVAIRAGDDPQLDRLRTWFPDVSSGTAKLSQVQTTLAREHGFANWPSLIAEVERRTAKRRERIARKEQALGDITALAERWFSLAEAGDLDRLWREMAVPALRIERARDLMLKSPERHDNFIAVLIEGLTHRQPRARFEYAHILDTFGDSRSIEPLKRLMDDPVPKVRWMAMHALTCHACNPDTCPDDPAMIARIAHHAQHDESPAVRRQATFSLGLARDRTLEPVLRDILANSPDERHRRAARDGLHEMMKGY